MNKEAIINEKKSLIAWVLSLKNLSDSIWFQPFKKGAWGTADVIAHFISWDRFIIENRIKPLLTGEAFPAVQVDVEATNQAASDYARLGIKKEDLIDEFISTREELILLLEKIPPEKFEFPYPGNKKMTISAYFVGMIEHDEKHKKQIQLHIKQNKTS
ncbi:DinB family protein [Niallia sp. 03133]|uniref:DinB family protein n=1 Tax=Niallia sp. 03133 TaxID=3458060 RepID=UPI004044FF5C